MIPGNGQLTRNYMKISTFNPVLPSILILFIYCNGQSLQSNDYKPRINERVGTTVSDMDDALPIIFHDRKGNYWFGSNDQGVYKYDGRQITQYSEVDGLANQRIRSIQEDSNGNLYFDTGSGISKYDGISFSTLPLKTGQSEDWVFNEEDLWFEGYWEGAGPYRYDGTYLYHMKFPKHDLEDALISTGTSANYSPYQVYKIFEDSRGYLWFGTAVLGACRYDGKNHCWVSERDMTEVDPGPAPGVRSILEDKSGHFWFSSNMNNKYAITDPQDSNGSNHIYKRLPGIPTDQIADLNYYFMSIAEDRDGNLWMVTYDNGVWKYDGKEIKHFPLKEGSKNVLLFTIYNDRKGTLWLGSHNAGVWTYNGHNFRRFRP